MEFPEIVIGVLKHFLLLTFLLNIFVIIIVWATLAIFIRDNILSWNVI